MDRLLLSLRQFFKSRNLTRPVTLFRQLFHFGPWRHLFIVLVRMRRKPSYFETSSLPRSGLFPLIEFDGILSELRNDGVASIGTLPEEVVKAVQSRTNRLPNDHFQNIHEVDPGIERIVRDPALTHLVRQYLRAEPAMLECTLTVTGGGSHSDQSRLQTQFHFDYAGWHSVNVFIYLTDVGGQSAFHTVITGTHRMKSIGDIFEQFLADETAQQRYGNRITPILGQAGTVFIENTEAFHKRKSSSERRVMLNILFASHKNWLSRGRTANANTRRRDRLYRQFIE